MKYHNKLIAIVSLIASLLCLFAYSPHIYAASNSFKFKKDLFTLDSSKRLKMVVGTNCHNRLNFDLPVEEVIGDKSLYNIMIHEDGKNVFIAPKVNVKKIHLSVILGNMVQDIQLNVDSNEIARSYFFIFPKLEQDTKSNMNGFSNHHKMPNEVLFKHIKTRVGNKYIIKTFQLVSKLPYIISTSKLVKTNLKDADYDVIWTSKTNVAPDEIIKLVIYQKI